MTNARLPGPGHNQGPPLDPMRSWRRHCWKVAKKALFRPLPLEVVRRRVARAARLGLTYRRYELLVLGGGEIEAMLFAGDTLVVTAPYASPAPGLDAGVVRKLAAVTGCRQLLLVGPDGLDPVWTQRHDAAALFEAAIRVPSRRRRRRRIAWRSGPDSAAAPCRLDRSRWSGTAPTVRPGSPRRGSPDSCPARSISAPDASPDRANMTAVHPVSGLL